MKKIALFQANKNITPEMEACKYHLNGCCFDPKKAVKGFVATPCFGCKEI